MDPNAQFVRDLVRERNEARSTTRESSTILASWAYASVKDLYRFTDVPAEYFRGRVLELGCFRGVRAAAMDGFVGTYTGIDISPSAVEHCRGLGLAGDFQFRVDDAHILASVVDGSVDYACGDGSLHHLDLEQAAPTLQRKLAPQGCARFIEPAQGNVLLRTFRRMTPKLRTPDEHPFDRDSIGIPERYFRVGIRYEGPATALAAHVVNRPWAIAMARTMDRGLLRHSIARREAWLLLLELRKR